LDKTVVAIGSLVVEGDVDGHGRGLAERTSPKQDPGRGRAEMRISAAERFSGESALHRHWTERFRRFTLAGYFCPHVSAIRIGDNFMRPIGSIAVISASPRRRASQVSEQLAILKWDRLRAGHLPQ
jgi:hypothetical protein